MCLIAFSWLAHPRFKLALIANRDEFHARPTAPAGWLDPQRRVFGGRDLVAGGGWLQFAGDGRIAAVTNVRQGRPEAAPRSRGALVAEFAAARTDAAAYLDELARNAGEYGRFNLLVGDGAALYHASNVPEFSAQRIAPGVYGLSNGGFDAPWPKLERARAGLAAWLDAAAAQAPTPHWEPLLQLLADTQPAEDAALPDTGVGIELERRLSPIFIRGDSYGTRSSTVLLVTDAGQFWFAERRHGPGGGCIGDSGHSGWLEPA